MLLVRRFSEKSAFWENTPASDGSEYLESGGRVNWSEVSLTGRKRQSRIHRPNGRPQWWKLLFKVSLTANDVLLRPQFATGEIQAEGQLGNGSLNVTGNSIRTIRGRFVVTAKQLPIG